MDVSLQLYSINQETMKDFRKSLEKVSEIGYKGVEFAGYGDLSDIEVADLLQKTNLYSVGSHCGLNAFTDTFYETLAFNKTIGSKYIICPYANVNSKEEIDTLVQALNFAGNVAAKENIKVGYHNHAHEFVKVDGKYALDIIAENTNDNVILELDVFWVAYAGIDPIEYIKKWGKKVELIHVKQINNNKANVEVADGILDMKKIKEAAEYATHFVVEQEEFDKPVWDAIRNNYETLSQM